MYDSTDIEAAISEIISLISAGRSEEALSSLRSLSGEIVSAFDEMADELQSLRDEVDLCREKLEECQEEKDMMELEPHDEAVFF